MKISYSPYTLKPTQNLATISNMSERKGVLLKIEWLDGLTGYSDLHPWSELGDQTWEQQLADMRTGQISQMLEQSIWMARRDAQARQQNKSLFDGLPTVKNNYLITDVRVEKPDILNYLKKEGFETIKIKLGRDLQKEAEFVSGLGLDGAFKLRLDFNALGTWQTYERFMKNLNKVALTRVQYVEDPFPFDEQLWLEAKKFAPLAIDNEFQKVDLKKLKTKPFDVVILKPAKMDVSSTLQACVMHDLKITVTSYMDHPVGVMHALAVACELKKGNPQRVLDAGCLTMPLFQMDSYSAMVVQAGPYLKRADTRGVGFSLLFLREPWNQLKTR